MFIKCYAKSVYKGVHRTRLLPCSIKGFRVLTSWAGGRRLDRHLLQPQMPSQIIFKIGENISCPTTSVNFYHGGCIPLNMRIMGPFRTFYPIAFKGLGDCRHPSDQAIGWVVGRVAGQSSAVIFHGSISRLARTFLVLRSGMSLIMAVLSH